MIKVYCPRRAPRECCARPGVLLSDARGICTRCRRRMFEPRKGWSVGAALTEAVEYAAKNTRGAQRLAAWALQREANRCPK